MELPREAELAAFNPMDNSSLSGTKLEALGWQGFLDADTGTEGEYVKLPTRNPPQDGGFPNQDTT